jgi:hypothetical protein
MRKLMYTLFSATLLWSCHSPLKSQTMSTGNNTLTESEKREGWQLLFDGTTTNGWHTYGKKGIGNAWKAQDGTLLLDAASKNSPQKAEGGDIVTDREFENFHLIYDWKIAPNGNSGLIFYVQEDPAKYQAVWHTGPEMQVLDNAGHPDAKITTHRAGDLYDLITAKETVKPANEWNTAEIISNNGQLRFRLNGEDILQTTMWNDEWKRMIANSKFKSMPGFGMFKKGKIALQDHGDNVWFRNIKIKSL